MMSIGIGGMEQRKIYEILRVVVRVRGVLVLLYKNTIFRLEL